MPLMLSASSSHVYGSGESDEFVVCNLSFVSCGIRIAGYIGRILVGNNAWTNNTGND